MSNYFNSKSQYSQESRYKTEYSNNNIFSKKLSDKREKELNDTKEEQHALKVLKDLSIDNFPELVSVEKKINPINQQGSTFLEKVGIKKEKVQNIKEEEYDIPYGWVLITRDKKSNRMVLKYNADYEADEKKKKDQEENKEYKKKLYSHEVINALVDLHLKRTQEYIDNWGYDEYERMFLDVNHDSEYFDKLDEKYEEEMEKLREQEESENSHSLSKNEDFYN